ncbi:MAG: AbrB/MazE/SpoVT family DNA-binding domain-containing protein, partial [Candidatus Latescibacteria bacterium]|nr:AbrB/MazE/SpoVT family DNA-binding domain-containing protein [Candidatus Latescibacterota bacterium]
VTVIEGKLVITPVAQQSYNLAELVAGITEENRHSEVDTGPAQGDEVW